MSPETSVSVKSIGVRVEKRKELERTRKIGASIWWVWMRGRQNRTDYSVGELGSIEEGSLTSKEICWGRFIGAQIHPLSPLRQNCTVLHRSECSVWVTLLFTELPITCQVTGKKKKKKKKKKESEERAGMKWNDTRYSFRTFSSSFFLSSRLPKYRGWECDTFCVQWYLIPDPFVPSFLGFMFPFKLIQM